MKLDASTVEIEERGVKLRLTVVDTPGFGDAIDNSNSFSAILEYIDEQYERFLRDESGLNRRNIVDNRIHCCFYFISPFGHGYVFTAIPLLFIVFLIIRVTFQCILSSTFLRDNIFSSIYVGYSSLTCRLKPLDIEFMKKLHNKVNIVPVIAKADCLTKVEKDRLKSRILKEIENNGIKIYPLPDCDSDEDEDYKEQVRQLKEAVPFAVCGSTTVLEVKGKKVNIDNNQIFNSEEIWNFDLENKKYLISFDFSKVRGRHNGWGTIEIENPEHCDFIKLRTMLM